MNVYMVINPSGSAYLVEAEELTINVSSGVIQLSNKKEIVAALPHGASVIKQSAIQKPEKKEEGRIAKI